MPKLGSCSRPTLFFLFLIWCCFLARGLFYSSFLPLWEGYDEWSHFAFIQEIVTTGQPLISRTTPVSREVDSSMQLAPAPWNTGVPYITEDDYWRLDALDRRQRIERLRAIPESWAHQPSPHAPPVYEALQPPLYYWISSFAYRLISRQPLLTRVLFLRYLSILIASFAIPFVFLLAQRVSSSTRTALLAAVLVSTLPELMINVGRIGNECLGIVLLSWLTLLALPSPAQTLSIRRAALTGIVLGLGLLTKAYFLTCIPALLVIHLLRLLRSQNRRLFFSRTSLVFVIASEIAAWWYIRNRITTGTWSGLLESEKLVHFSLPRFWNGAMKVNWLTAIDSILVSHIWFGGWSFLLLRSWAYHFLFLVIALGILGVAVTLWKNPRQRRLLLPLLLIYGFFWLGQLYNVLLQFLTKGASTSMGWYMYCVIASEMILLVIGIQSLLPARLKYAALCALVLILGALDIYSVHFIGIPYYIGLTAHAANAATVPIVHVDQVRNLGIGQVLARLTSAKPSWLTPSVLASSWLLYLIATFALIGLSFRLLFGPNALDTASSSILPTQSD